MPDPIVIASYARTPMGGFQGALSGLKATELGAAAVQAAVARAGVSPQAVDQIVMGVCCRVGWARRRRGRRRWGPGCRCMWRR